MAIHATASPDRCLSNLFFFLKKKSPLNLLSKPPEIPSALTVAGVLFFLSFFFLPPDILSNLPNCTSGSCFLSCHWWSQNNWLLPSLQMCLHIRRLFHVLTLCFLLEIKQSNSITPHSLHFLSPLQLWLLFSCLVCPHLSLKVCVTLETG